MAGGSQFSKALAQNIWKAVAAFGCGVLAVIGGGLILSDVHRIPQGARLPAAGVSQPLDTSATASKQKLLGGGESQAVQIPQDSTSATGNSAAARDPAYLSRRRYPSRSTVAKIPSKNEDSGDKGNLAIAPPAIGSALAPQMMPAQSAASLPNQIDSSAASKLIVLADTPITVRLTQQVSSKDSRTGEVFKGSLAAPLLAQGIVVAEAGAPVIGRVVNARSPRFFRGGSNLNLELTQVGMPDGTLARVKTTQWYETGAHSRVARAAIFPSEAAKKVVSGIKPEGEEVPSSPEKTVAPEAADSEKGEKKGSAVTLPSGSEIVFKLIDPLTVEDKREHR